MTAEEAAAAAAAAAAAVEGDGLMSARSDAAGYRVIYDRPGSRRNIDSVSFVSGTVGTSRATRWIALSRLDPWSDRASFD